MQTKDLEKLFRVMGLEPGASMAEVKEAYRFLVQTFHEDKYPANHPYQDKARNKMVELNLAYEKLKLFFEENPTGVPEGGWSSEPEHEYRTEEDDMDWQTWQTDQQASWGNELNEWYERDLKRRADLKLDDARAGRQRTVTFSRYAVVAAFFCLLIGHSNSQVAHGANDSFNSNLAADRMRYDFATHGTSNSAYIMPDSQIVARDSGSIQSAADTASQDAKKDSDSSLLLLVLGGGILYFFFSQKGKTLLVNWVNG